MPGIFDKESCLPERSRQEQNAVWGTPQFSQGFPGGTSDEEPAC